jgi:hypothetical protein
MGGMEVGRGLIVHGKPKAGGKQFHTFLFGKKFAVQRMTKVPPRLKFLYSEPITHDFHTFVPAKV